MGVDIPVDRSFQNHKNPDSFKSWRSCSFQSYQKPGTHYASRQLSSQSSFWELPNSCQQRELTFLSTAGFRGTKILLTMGVDIPVDRSFQNYQSPNNFKSWRSCNFQSYQRPGWRYVSRQLLELTTVVFRATKKFKTLWFLLTVWVDNDRFRKYLRKLKSVCFRSTVWVNSLSFHSYFWNKKHC